jgi:hypothetical protein
LLPRQAEVALVPLIQHSPVNVKFSALRIILRRS